MLRPIRLGTILQRANSVPKVYRFQSPVLKKSIALLHSPDGSLAESKDWQEPPSSNYTSFSAPYSLSVPSNRHLYKQLFQHNDYSVERLANDTTTAKKYLNFLRKNDTFTDKQVEDIATKYEVLVEIVSGLPNKDALSLLFEILHIIAWKDSRDLSITTLQKRLLSNRQLLLFIILNSRNFPIYNSILVPIYNKFELADTWDDIVIKTLQLKYQNGVVSMNETSIRSFLNSKVNHIKDKRQLLARMLKIGFLNTSNTDEKEYFIENFLRFTKQIGDDHLLYVDSDYKVYEEPLRLIATPNEGFTSHMAYLEGLFSRLDFPESYFCNFMTSSMIALVPFSPNNVLNFWKYKLEFIAKFDLPTSKNLHYKDLNSVMEALSKLNLFPTAVSIYKSYPGLQNDEQIEILLRISKKSKDWKMLQKQFEEMYGRGKLPFVLHYSIVMNTLASMGAKSEVDNLYQQLIKRKLTPSPSIFVALINSRLYYDDIDGAKTCFDEYMEFCAKNPNSKNHSAYLYSLIFKIHFNSSDMNKAFKFLEETLQLERKIGFTLVDSETLSNFITFAASNNGLAEIIDLQRIAIEKNLQDSKVYSSLIRAFTQFGQYELADKLIYEFHRSCDLPFTLSEVYALQLRNYRLWWKATPDSRLFSLFNIKMQYIKDLALENKVISPKNNGALLNEIIKYHLFRGEVVDAWKTLDVIKIKEVLNENHFLIFLKHYSHIDTFKSHTNVLNIYKMMSDSRVRISSLTYVYLMKALVYLDKQGHHHNENSFKLLQSIFEIYGLTLREGDAKLKPVNSLVQESAVDLCKIVSIYVLANSSNQTNIDILVHFFNQIKEILGTRISQELRFTIYKEMSNIYLIEGKIELAESLVNSGLKELDHLIEKFNNTYPFKEREPTKIPPALSMQYQSLMKLKLNCMRIKNEPSDAYAKLLAGAIDLQIQLTGSQYSFLTNAILKDNNSTHLPLILGICEDYLVRGNLVEIQIYGKLKNLYKLAILDIANYKGDDFVHRYDLLNEYYDIKSISHLRKELLHVSNPFQEFTKQLKRDKHIITSNQWSVKKIFGDIPGFFLPERKIKTTNQIQSPYFVSRMVEKYCHGDIEKAFKLMDEYPLTMSYLIFFTNSKYRIQRFRHKIDEIIPPQGEENFLARRNRTYLALNYMKPERYNSYEAR